MGAFFLDTVLPLLGTLALGALGWLATHFLLNPILRFYRLRERAVDTLEFTRNVCERKGNEEAYDGAHRDIRRLGTQVAGIELTAARPVRRFLKMRGYDLGKAKAGLIALSSTSSDSTGAKAASRWDAEKGLKLPLTYTTRPKIRD